MMIIAAGSKYVITRPGMPIADEITMPDGTVIEFGPFDDQVFNVEVIEKPNMIYEDCGHGHKRMIRLPDHLKDDGWLAVRNLSNGLTHFLNIDGCKVEKLENE